MTQERNKKWAEIRWRLLCYGKSRWTQMLPSIIILVSFHLYFMCFLHNGTNLVYLLYLDILLFVPGIMWAAVDYSKAQKEEKQIQELMDGNMLICKSLPQFAGKEIARHDVRVLEEQMSRQFEESCQLQDYVAKWCHELKIPLAAGLLIAEGISEPDVKQGMRGQLEKMNQQLNSLLLGCRLQSPLFDLQVKKVLLSECVKASIRNNQFFLIQNHFSLETATGKQTVYTDPTWLVYILDQLIGNAVKYAKKCSDPAHQPEAYIHIWSEKKERAVWLFLEDGGEGIRTEDMGRIFEKGYTGRNYHNGKYKSTGLGLYMAEKIIRRLGHEIRVESEYGKYTRFCLIFWENDSRE